LGVGSWELWLAPVLLLHVIVDQGLEAGEELFVISLERGRVFAVDDVFSFAAGPLRASGGQPLSAALADSWR
jgi:hypothetical protein